MKTIVVSGKIGSGKSSALRNLFFLSRFSPPYERYSLDDIAKQLYYSPRSQCFFLNNPYFRKCVHFSCSGNSPVFSFSLLKKQLFFGENKNIYWTLLEASLHPQMIKWIQRKEKKRNKKKGTLFFECAIPSRFWRDTDIIQYCNIPSSPWNVLPLIRYRKMIPSEILTILKRQKQ